MASCPPYKPPYCGPNIIPGGPNIVTNISDKNLKTLREAICKNPANCNSPANITIALTDLTLDTYIIDRDNEKPNKTDAFLQMVVKYGFVPTVRIYGFPAANHSAKIAQNLSAALANNGLSGAKVEFGNEPNLEYPGGTVVQKAQNYAAAYINFAKNCTSCSMYLPALGGTNLKNKEDFANTFFSLLKKQDSLVKNIKGITFNSYADTPFEAITDWLSTLTVWQKAASGNGVSLDGLTYFLTEVGPPGADSKYPNLKAFAQGIVEEFNKLKKDDNYCQAKLGDLCGAFDKLVGFSFFIWDPLTEKLYLLYVDENGNFVLEEQEVVYQPSSTNPDTYVEPDTETAPFSQFPEESIELCPDDDKPAVAGQPYSPIANVTTTPPPPIGLITTPELREDAGLGFGRPVKVRSDYVSKLCAQKQGEPIVLEETAYYNILDKGCIQRPWTGEITVSGMTIPFAQSIADHWAGTLDTEHLTPEEYENLYYRATKEVKTEKDLEDRLKAKNELDQRAGVLRKILPQATIDKLKADFILYVYKRSYRKNTLYQDGLEGAIYKPDGKIGLTEFTQVGFRQDFCNGQKTAKECKDWEDKYGRAWNMIPLFPNEEAKGQLKFMVCGDKQYILKTAIPEVFRLGLAANVLQQISTPKETMDKFYELYPEFKASDITVGSFPKINNLFHFAQTETDKEKSFWEKALTRIEDLPVLKEIIKPTKLALPKIRSAFARAQEIYHNPSRLLTQAQSKNGTLNINLCAQNKGGQVVYWVNITTPNYPGGGGHITTELWKNGEKTGLGIQNFVDAGGTLSYGSPNSDGVTTIDGWPTFSPNDTVGFQIKCDDCNTADQGVPIRVDVKTQGTAPTCLGAPPVQGGGQCSNGSCSFQIQQLEKTPPQPDTEVFLWNKEAGGYTPEGKFTIGAPKGVIFNINNNPDPNSEDFKKCSANPGGCIAKATNTREIGVYNNVPMLVTTWLQAAGKIELDPLTTLSGFMYNYTPLSVYGSSGTPAFDLGNFCSNNQEDVLNEDGTFKEIDAQSTVTYDFVQTRGHANNTTGNVDSSRDSEQCATADDCAEMDGMTLIGCSGAPRRCRYRNKDGQPVTPQGVTKTVSNPNLTGVDVQMSSPRERNLLWYRLKGLCNANKWWSERVLNPFTIGLANVFGPAQDSQANSLSGKCSNCNTPLKDFPPATGKDGNLCGWQRPAGDTCRCIHFRIDASGYIAALDAEKEAGEWAHIEELAKEMRDMGMKWTVVLYSSEKELERAAKLFKKYGITPVWRRNLKADQLRLGEYARDVEIVKKAGLEPYFQIYNEPDLPIEWKNGRPNDSVFVNNWISSAIEIYNAGGKPGLQVIDEDQLKKVLNKIGQLAKTTNPSITKLYSNMFFVPHLYDERASGNGVLNYQPFADVFKSMLGFVPPFIVGEGGYLDKLSTSQMADEYAKIFSQCQNGSLPNYIFAYCPWNIESNKEEFSGPSWYNNKLMEGQNRQELIDRIKNMSKAPAAGLCKE